MISSTTWLSHDVRLPSLKLTFSALKNGAWETTSLLGFGQMFQVRLLLVYWSALGCPWKLVTSYIVGWSITYIRDLQPTYIGVIIHLLSTMDIPAGDGKKLVRLVKDGLGHSPVYHGPLLSHLLGVAPSTFTMVYRNANWKQIVIDVISCWTWGSFDSLC